MEAIKVLHTEKELVPKLRFDGFDENWQVKYLRELLEFKNGINASKEQYGKGIKFINVLDILNNEYITYDSIIGSVDVDEIVASKYPVKYGDILFQRSSETRQEVGTACVYLDLNKTAVFGGFVIRGRKIGEYDPVFLNTLLKTDISRNEITSKSGGSTRYNVGQETLSSVALGLPSLPEQQKIASFLSAVDEKIQQLTRKKELLEQYKKGVMQQLFSGKLRFKDQDGKAFAKWEVKTLGDVGTVIRGASPRPQGDKRYYGGNVPRLMVKDVTRDGKFVTPMIDYLTEEGAKLSRPCKAGTLTIVCSGTVGIPSFLAVDACIHDGFLAVIEIDSHYHPDYIYHNLTTLRDKFESTATHGGVFTNLTTTSIKEFEVTFPCFLEQKKIANYLSTIDTKIESVTKQITQTQTFKKGLLQQMFV